MKDLNTITDSFSRDGYVVLEELLTAEECDELREKSKRHVDQLDLKTHPRTVFSTTQQKNDEYFMQSQDKIRYFFEDGVFNENGSLNRDVHLCINKIGHGLHYLDEDYKKVTHHPYIQEVIRSLGFEEPTVNQSMVIFKQPNIGGKVIPHQDGSFLMNEPLKLVGVWIALEDTNVENACLQFIPGSHTKGIEREMHRNEDGLGTTFTRDIETFDEKQFVPVPIKKGSAIVIHGQVVHASAKNISKNSREIYTFHVAESKNTTWRKENWLQETDTYKFPLLYT